MYIKVLTQVYWPDDVSTAQHLVDLCEQLVEQGADVEVIASYRKYEDRSIKFPISETRNGVRIKRLRDTGFGKGTVLGRILDFASYNFLLFFAILFGKKPDLYLGMTSPPLVSVVGGVHRQVKGFKVLLLDDGLTTRVVDQIRTNQGRFIICKNPHGHG